MTLTNLFQIDGNPLPVPSAMPKLTYNRLISSDSGRDEAGYLHQEIIRDSLLTCDLVYDWLTSEEYTYIIGLFAGKSTFAFTHPKAGSTTETVTDTCHIDGWSAAMFSPRRNRWAGLTLTIEQN